MKEKNNKIDEIQVTEGSLESGNDELSENLLHKFEKGRKRIIFTLMVVAFLGCMYLLFGPSKKEKITGSSGLNEQVPQANSGGLQSDKQKAYEQDMLEKKEQERKKGLLSLSDYWNSEKSAGKDSPLLGKSSEEQAVYNAGGTYSNVAVASYRNMQSTLGSFYQQDNPETEELRHEIADLKEQLAEKEDQPPVNNVQDQLDLMEKSYQMAAKYLPSKSEEPDKKDTVPYVNVSDSGKPAVSFQPDKQAVVSALYREDTDSAFQKKWAGERNMGFYTVGAGGRMVQPKNSIRACVEEAQTVTGESDVRLRLLENASIPNRTIRKGTVLTAHAKFQTGRLQLQITSIELEGNIIPLNLAIYDLDGQRGLAIPNSQEMNALTEMASNMSQTSGTSIMMTRSAGQQVAGDLSRGVIQGISGYLSKKIRTPKVRLKAGYRLFLLSEK